MDVWVKKKRTFSFIKQLFLDKNISSMKSHSVHIDKLSNRRVEVIGCNLKVAVPYSYINTRKWRCCSSWCAFSAAILFSFWLFSSSFLVFLLVTLALKRIKSIFKWSFRFISSWGTRLWHQNLSIYSRNNSKSAKWKEHMYKWVYKKKN